MISKTWVLTALLTLPAAFAAFVTGISNPAPVGFEQWISPRDHSRPARRRRGAKKLIARLTLEEGIDIGGYRYRRPNGVCLTTVTFGHKRRHGLGHCARRSAMGAEFRGKVVNVASGLMTNMGRQAAAGRNWEGFGPNLFLSGVTTVATINGIQRNSVISTVKRFCVSFVASIRPSFLLRICFSPDFLPLNARVVRIHKPPDLPRLDVSVSLPGIVPTPVLRPASCLPHDLPPAPSSNMNFELPSILSVLPSHIPSPLLPMLRVPHSIANEQEHFCGGSEASQIHSSNFDDKTFNEMCFPLLAHFISLSFHSFTYTHTPFPLLLLCLSDFAEAIHRRRAVVCAYNKIDQTQACQNSKIINGVLEELGFMGFVMSDSDQAAMIDGIQPTLARLDMNMPAFFAYEPVQRSENGNVPEARVDNTMRPSSTFLSRSFAIAVEYYHVNSRASRVVRTFAASYKVGHDKGYPPISLKDAVNVQADHYKLIRQIGAASTILQENTNKALPLAVKNIKRIAIIGSDLGPNPDGANGCSDCVLLVLYFLNRGCSQGTMAIGWGSGALFFRVHLLIITDRHVYQAPRTSPTSSTPSWQSRHIKSINPIVVIDAVLNDLNITQVRAVTSCTTAEGEQARD
ncbi:Beta-glucosidase [Mycena venus]|uniref:beta-glucosidase n=1 Tax=Mycena venus TaxID=2733690 RepID=A0A8H6Z6J8_9AGAR|nr:Beta-glucosidase [Mycena venus]